MRLVRKKIKRGTFCSAAMTCVLLLGIYFLAPFSWARGAETSVPVQILAINDFHGYLNPPPGESSRIRWLNKQGTITTISAGGAAQLAYALRAARHRYQYSVTVGAGDLIGASPLVSSAYADQPSIEVMNSLGLQTSSVGNHEFDAGYEHLLSVAQGNCQTLRACVPGDHYSGAHFSYLAANTHINGDSHTLFPPYWIWRKGPITIGFIGLPLQQVPSVTTIKGSKDLSFAPEVATIDHYVKILHRQGINNIFVLIHQGGVPTLSAANSICDVPSQQLHGPIVQLAQQINSDVLAIISAHSHQAYICSLPDPKGHPRLVTQASSYGRLFTEFNFTYNLRNGLINRDSITASQHVISSTGPAATDVARQVAQWNQRIYPVAHRIVGYAQQGISRARFSHTIQSSLGQVVADSQQEAMRPVGSELALLNSGGVRSDLFPDSQGLIRYGDIHAVQPFHNFLYTVDLTGSQFLHILRQQISESNAVVHRFLQVSSNLTYTIDHTGDDSYRINVSSIRINGQPLELHRTYHITVNDFLAQGGDGFTVFTQATHRVRGIQDHLALENYIHHHSKPDHPFIAPTQSRVLLEP